MENLIQRLQQDISEKKIFFPRRHTLKKLVEELNNKKIVILSGMRYMGKTKLLKEMITKTSSEKDFFYYNSEVDLLGKIQNSEDLEILLWLHIRIHWEPKILILQNISKINDIKDYIWKLYTQKKYKIIIVGNNIKISGIPEIELHPQKTSAISRETITQTLKYGSIEEVTLVRDLSYKNLLLKSILQHILSQDILYTYDIKNKYLYMQILAFLAKKTQNTSLRELQRELEAEGVSIALMTLTDYIDAGIRSKLLRKMSKYDIKSKKEIASKIKYYFSDTGIRNTLLWNISDMSIQIENTLLSELTKHGYNLTTGIHGRFEFTCRAKKSKDTLDIHIHHSDNKNELKKDIRKLAKIPGNHKKFLLVYEKESYSLRKYEIDGVVVCELWEVVSFLQ